MAEGSIVFFRLSESSSARVRQALWKSSIEVNVEAPAS